MVNITTRINLRNDTLSNWLTSTVALNKGEVAFARLSGELSDRYEARIGVGDKTWSQLSGGGIQIPAGNVTGLAEAIASLSTSYYETDDIATLSDTASYVNGDIAVQKNEIGSSGNYQYIAYRWSYFDSTYKWMALDSSFDIVKALSDEIEMRISADESLLSSLSVSIEDGGTPEMSSILKTYVVKQGGVEVGKIDIPKDFLVKSAEVCTVTSVDVPYEGAQPGDKYIDFEINAKSGSTEDSHIYIPIKDFFVPYSAGVTDTISVCIAADNTISAVVRDNSIGTSHISAKAVTTGKIADGAIGTAQIDDGAVTTDKIADSAVINSKLGLSSITIDCLSGDVIDYIESISSSSTEYIDSKVSAMSCDWSSTASKTVVSVAQHEGVVSLSAVDIAILASQVTDLTSVIDNYVPLSVASNATSEDKLQKASDVASAINAAVNALDVEETAIAASKTITSISETDGKISVVADDIQIAQSQVTGLTTSLDSIISSISVLSDDMSSLESSKLDSSEFSALSNAIGLSAATAENQVVTKDDIKNLAGAMHFKGAVTDLSSVTSADPGDIVIVIDTSKEYVYNGESGAAYLSTNWIELGDEDLYATKGDVETISSNLASRDTYISGIVDSLSDGLAELCSNVETLSSNALTGVALNGIAFDIAGNIASLSIIEISCGNASI